MYAAAAADRVEQLCDVSRTRHWWVRGQTVHITQLKNRGSGGATYFGFDPADPLVLASAVNYKSTLITRSFESMMIVSGCVPATWS